MHPLTDYAVSDDFAFGYEQMGGFQRVLVSGAR